MNRYHYSSVLRAVQGKNAERGLFEMLEKYPGAYDEVAFMVGLGGPWSAQHHRQIAEGIQPLLKRMEEKGLKTGLNVIPTIGFFPPLLDEELRSYPQEVDIFGNVNEGRLCGGNAKNHAYIKDFYRGYAAVSTGVIYVDDDVPAPNCFCEDCVRRFGALYDVFDGLEATRENLRELFAHDDLKIRQKVREAWLDFIALRNGEILAAVEEGVSEVDPDRELGLMSCTCGRDGLESELWVRKLQGNTNRKIRWRPGGGCYTEYTTNKVLNKVNRVGGQIRYIPDSVLKIESELENFPGQYLRKTPAFAGFEILMYLAAGCTGTSYSGTCPDSDCIEEHEGYFELAQRICAAGELIVDVFQREKPEGIGFWWNRRSTIDLKEKVWDLGKNCDVPFANEIYQLGLPVAYHTEKTRVFLLTENIALQMSQEEVLEVLSKGVLMDEGALKVLNERGFGDLTGFAAGKRYTKAITERETSHPINMPGEHERTVYVGFNNGEEVCRPEAYSLVKTNEAAQALSLLLDESGEGEAIGCGVFENRLGGRIAVDGVDPFDWYYSLPRSIRLKNLMRWLSRDSISCIKSFHRMALWVRGNAAYVANMAMDEAKGAELLLQTDARKAKVWVFKGGSIIEETVVEAVGDEGNCKKFCLPEIPITGSALIQCCAT